MTDKVRMAHGEQKNLPALAPPGRPAEFKRTAVQRLQQGAGNHAFGRLLARAQADQPPGTTQQGAFRVNQPGDAFERQAEAVVVQVTQGAGIRAAPVPPAPLVAPRPRSAAAPAVSPATATLLRNPGAGRPLPALTQHRLEPHLGTGLADVRVHDGPHAAAAATALGARAFTHGSDIFLGPRESMHDTRLMAHEATHVVQQGAAAAQAPAIQRDLLGDIGGGLVSAAESLGEAAGDVVEMGADFFWSLVETLAPEFAPILREINAKGILAYFGEKIRATFMSIFDSLSADPGVIGVLTTTFLDLFGQAQAILAPLAGGDCQPLLEAVNQLQALVAQLAGDAWNAIAAFFQPVGNFFNDLWQQLGAPLADWLAAAAGDVWQWIQELGAQIWAWTQPVRDAPGAAWTWVTEQLFGQADPQAGSEGGLASLITGLAGQAWDAIKAELEPVIAPIRSFAESVMALLPLDAILNLRATVQGWVSNVQNMAQNMSQPQDVADNQDSLRAILPGVLASIATMRDSLAGAGQWIATQVGVVAAAVTGFYATLGGISLLSPLAGALGWLQETVTSLSGWAQATVTGLFTAVGDGLVYLAQFIEPLVTMLEQLVALVTDLLGVLPNFITGIWNSIPACIREPIEQFIVDNILSQIPGFAQILQIPDIWARISQTVMTILRQLFVDGNLAGALWTYLQALLTLVGIPPELVVSIIGKAATAIGDILADPVGFFITLLSAVQQGFVNFFANIGRHLLTGVTDWLFEELRQVNIEPPQDFTLRSIIEFVLDVLGITVDNFFDRLGRRIGTDKAQSVRDMVDKATGAIRWLYLLVTDGPGALWEEIQGQLSSLWQIVLSSVIGWVTGVVIKQGTVWLLGLLDPTGIMAVVNSLVAIYKAIQSAAQYVRPMLEVVVTVLDAVGGIARGVTAQGAAFLESGIVRILPLAIGFLANQVGLGGVGRRVGEMVEEAREYVNQGIDWLINSAIKAFEALLGRSDQPAAPAGVTGELGAVGDTLEFSAVGDPHHLWVQVVGSQATLVVASEDPMSVDAKLKEWSDKVDSLPETAEEGRNPRAEAKQLIADAKLLLNSADHVADTIAAAGAGGARSATPDETKLSKEEEALAKILTALFDLFGVPEAEEFQPVVEEFVAMDGSHHTLTVHEDQDQDLLLASERPSSYYQFLNGIDPKNDPKIVNALAAARAIVEVYYRIRGLRMPDDAAVAAKAREAKREAYRELLKELWVETDILLGTAKGDIPTGDSEMDAIPIDWYKPLWDTNLYPTLKFADEDGKPFTLDATGPPEQVLHPYEPQKKIRIGVAKEFHFEVGTRFKNEKKGERGPRTAEFRNIVSEYGNPLEGLHADHILNLNFGGVDDYPNIWLFDEKANTSAGQRQNAQIVVYKDSKTGQVRSVAAGDIVLKLKWFKVVKVGV